MSCIMIPMYCSTSPFGVRYLGLEVGTEIPNSLTKFGNTRWSNGWLSANVNCGISWHGLMPLTRAMTHSVVLYSSLANTGYFEKQSTTTRKSCHPRIIMPMVTCKKGITCRIIMQNYGTLLLLPVKDLPGGSTCLFHTLVALVLYMKKFTAHGFWYFQALTSIYQTTDTTQFIANIPVRLNILR